jgi:hypothetical protein
MTNIPTYRVAILGRFIGETDLEKKILGVDHIDVIEMHDNMWDLTKLRNYDGFLAWHDLFIDSKTIDYLKDTCKGIVRVVIFFNSI